MFRDMKIAVRLGLGFSLVIMLLLVIAATGIAKLGNMNESLDRIVSDRYAKVAMANTINEESANIGRYLRNMLLVKDQEQVKQEISKLQESAKVISDNLDKLDKIT